MGIQNIAVKAGFLVVTPDSGGPREYAVADLLRAADIPNLNIGSLTLLTTLAQVVAVLVKTLIDKDILDEGFADGYDLDYVQETLEDDLNAEWPN